MAGKPRKKTNRKPTVFGDGDVDDISFEIADVLEGFIEEAVARSEPITIRGRGKRSPAWRAFDKANDLVGDATLVENPTDQMEMAREAIAISADCSSAFGLLGNLALEAGDDSAEGYFREGIAAGERLLGTAALEKHAGKVGRIAEARGYLTCRRGLIQCLILAGRAAEAADACRSFVRLDAEDAIAARCIFLDLLIDLGQFDEARELCVERGSDHDAEWAFSRALVEFAATGDTPAARSLLADAIRMNPFVSDLLLSGEPVGAVPFFGMPGGEDEAKAYVEISRRSWLDVRGALSWFREVTNTPLRPAPEARRKSPGVKNLEMLATLPQHEDETWQVDLRQNDDRGWAFFVATDDGRLLLIDSSDSRPSATTVWALLEDAMRRPSDGDPRRPAAIAARLGVFPKSWNARLARLDIAQDWRDSLDVIDAAVAGVDDQIRAAAEAAEAESNPLADPRAEAVDLAALPQALGEVWEAAVRLAPSWVTGEGEPYRPWFGLVASQTQDHSILPDLRTEPPGEQTLLRLIHRAIRHAGVRPACIEVTDDATVESLAKDLEPSGIDVRRSAQGLPTIARLFSLLADSMGGPVSVPPLAKVPGMTEAIQRDLYAAAAEYYRARPWRKAPSDSVIDIREPGANGRLCHVVVMGQSGVQQGLAIYEDTASLEAALSGDEKASTRGTSMALMYGEPFEIHTSDLDTIEQHGFEIAGPEAWPLVIRMNPGRSIRPPLAWEVELFAVYLRAVPPFLAAVPFQRRGGRSGGRPADAWIAPSGHRVSWH
jgi:tetratricopeptide (TPR) repeat protein